MSTAASPASLAAFRDAILHRRDGSGRPCLAAEDVAVLRGLLCQATGPVTRVEAEVLFDLAEATAGQDNDPAFPDLFARAFGNYLLGLAGHPATEARDALRRDLWLNERQDVSGGLRGVFSRVLTCVISGDGFLHSGGGWLAQGAADTILDQVLWSGDLRDAAEAGWLRERLARSAPEIPALVALDTFLRVQGTAERPFAKVA
ncbi:MAG: hypothetical protein U1E62_10405 [Alsobacter sp.]